MGDSFNLKCHVMDFKVKSQLLPLLFSGGMAAAQAQTVLQQDTHMLRAMSFLNRRYSISLRGEAEKMLFGISVS